MQYIARLMKCLIFSSLMITLSSTSIYGAEQTVFDVNKSMLDFNNSKITNIIGDDGKDIGDKVLYDTVITIDGCSY